MSTAITPQAPPAEVSHPGRALPSERAGGVSAPPRVSVIVPVHNGGEKFLTCLGALAAAEPPAFEWIVVGDGDAGDSSAAASAAGARVLQTPRRSGPAAARNLGARAARGEVLYFIDADVAIHPGSVGFVRDFFAAEPGVVALIGSYDDEPSEPDTLSQYANLRHHFVHQHAREKAVTFWGACGAIRRNAFLAVGGFDESYPEPSIEDIELGYRLTEAGYAIRLRRELRVKHLKRWTPRSVLRTDLFQRAIPWTRLMRRSRVASTDLNVRPKAKLSVALAWLLPATLLAALAWPPLLLAAAAEVAGLVALDWPLLRFFRAKRGWGFALRAGLWHVFYHAYCGAGWVLGTLWPDAGRGPSRRTGGDRRGAAASARGVEAKG